MSAHLPHSTGRVDDPKDWRLDSIEGRVDPRDQILDVEVSLGEGDVIVPNDDLADVGIVYQES